jgi:hypothetical protein
MRNCGSEMAESRIESLDVVIGHSLFVTRHSLFSGVSDGRD